jgi:hypothetical protein
MTDQSAAAPAAGLAAIAPEILARRLERQRDVGERTLLRDLHATDRVRVANWCKAQKAYPELVKLLAEG